MTNDNLLNAKIREALQTGDLPRRAPDKLWGGPATGARCAMCGASTTLGEVELELEFSRDADALQTYHAHPSCLAIFILEVERLFGRGVSRGTA